MEAVKHYPVLVDHPRKVFSRGSGWIKILHGTVPRFSATALLCRLRATETLMREEPQYRFPESWSWFGSDGYGALC
jgi:hypothetical protein